MRKSPTQKFSLPLFLGVTVAPLGWIFTSYKLKKLRMMIVITLATGITSAFGIIAFALRMGYGIDPSIQIASIGEMIILTGVQSFCVWKWTKQNNSKVK